MAAGVRGVTTLELTSKILHAVLGARLVDAVLDRSGRRAVIELPSQAVRDYLVQFGVAAIYVTSAGKLGVGRDLSRAAPLAAAWWVRDRRSAEQILAAVGQEHPESVEETTTVVLAAAARIGTTLSDATVLQRAKTAVLELDARLASANAAGTLQFMNREYKRRRLEVKRAGRRFISSGEMQLEEGPGLHGGDRIHDARDRAGRVRASSAE